MCFQIPSTVSVFFDLIESYWCFEIPDFVNGMWSAESAGKILHSSSRSAHGLETAPGLFLEAMGDSCGRKWFSGDILTCWVRLLEYTPSPSGPDLERTDSKSLLQLIRDFLKLSVFSKSFHTVPSAAFRFRNKIKQQNHKKMDS